MSYVCTAGQVIHTLPEGETVLGVTLLADKIYLLRRKYANQVVVYDVNTYRLLRSLTVPNCSSFADMTSCEHHRCVYIIAVLDSGRIYRLDVQGAIVWWNVNDKPSGLSVNADSNLLVTCVVRTIQEFTTHGTVVREIRLPDGVVSPLHAIQLSTGQFVVCHGSPGDSVHRVCVISPDGRRIVRSHGGMPASDVGHYDIPRHLAVNSQGFVFVAEIRNRRVTLLSPTLEYVCHVLSSNQLKWQPFRLCLDVQRGRLYVADTERKGDNGRVVVFRI